MARKPTDLRPISIRMPEKLRARLERAAKRSERSMNAEILYRLESSFSYEDAFEGEDLRTVAIEMSVAFQSAGAAAAYSRGIGADWISEPECFRAAAFGVLKTLMLKNREAADDLEGMMLQCEALKGAIATHIVNARKPNRGGSK